MEQDLPWLKLVAASTFCLAGLASLAPGRALAQSTEKCTTQSQMQPSDRQELAAAAAGLAGRVLADDQAGVKALTIAEFQKDFGGIAGAVAETSNKVKGDAPQVEQVYLLDASAMKAVASGGNPDAQFFCTLNKSASETEFAIPQLPPGKYAFAMVRLEGASPWRLSFLLRQDGGKWLLAGFYPKPLTASGHDGLWYWKQARTYGAEKQTWASWLYLQEAQALVLPAAFVSSTHLDKLQSELQAATPPAIGNGLSADAPLVLKGVNGAEYRFTGLSVDDSVGLDIAAHLKVDAADDVNAARKRNTDAALALITAHPELRSAFHGVWIFAEAPGKDPFATEVAMSALK